MLLAANFVRLGHELLEVIVQAGHGLDAKVMHMVPGRDRFDLMKPGTLDPLGEHKMTHEPILPWADLSKRHASLKSNAGLFRQDDYRPKCSQNLQEVLEQLANVG